MPSIGIADKITLDKVLANTQHLYTLLVQAVNFRWNSDANWYAFNRINNNVLSPTAIEAITATTTTSNWTSGNGTCNVSIPAGGPYRFYGSHYMTGDYYSGSGGVYFTPTDVRLENRNIGKITADWKGDDVREGNGAGSPSASVYVISGVSQPFINEAQNAFARRVQSAMVNGIANNTSRQFAFGYGGSANPSGSYSMQYYDCTLYSCNLQLLAAVIDGTNKLKMEAGATSFDVMSSTFTVDSTLLFDMYDKFQAVTENGGTWIFDIYASDGVTLLKENVAPGADISDIPTINTSLKLRVRCTRPSTADPIPALVNCGFDYFKRK